ncbi:MAG TPA: hypothetical protein VLV83_15340 [Acidobacteriota bacterium]|nr:hypothetical protein [Acidobacteriota bacterium]
MVNTLYRILFVLTLIAIACVGVWASTGHGETGWLQAKATLDSATMEGSFFEGTEEEVSARIDNLVLMNVEPVQSFLSYDSRGPVSKSLQKYVVFSPDMNRVFGLTVSCSGSCTGNGCGVAGCAIVAGNCGECNCTGDLCSAQCVCTKTSTFSPEGGGQQ